MSIPFVSVSIPIITDFSQVADPPLYDAIQRKEIIRRR
jgi:hypothetical protein